MARSAKKRHQKKKVVPKSHQRMMDKLQESGDFPNLTPVERPEGMVKLSDAISEIIEPYEYVTDTLEAYKKLVTVACLAWNIEITPKLLRTFKIQGAMKEFTGMNFRDKQDFKAIIKELIKRKEFLYPEDERMIVDYEITESKKDFHLQIAYVMRPKEYEKSKKKK